VNEGSNLGPLGTSACPPSSLPLPQWPTLSEKITVLDGARDCALDTRSSASAGAAVHRTRALKCPCSVFLSSHYLTISLSPFSHSLLSSALARFASLASLRSPVRSHSLASLAHPRAVFTLSGTLGAAYVAVGRAIPAVAFSAGNSTKRSYKDWNPADPEDIGASPLPLRFRAVVLICFFLGRVANVHAKLAADLVSALAYGVDISKGEKVLPPGLGLNVNFPKINGTPLPTPLGETAWLILLCV
jgi:hypothetical protein